MAKLDKLDKLYQTVANCEELGLELPNGVIEQINDMEEKLIKDEVLPLIHDNIEPTLRRVKRPLVLVVEYDPQGALRVNLSRKVNIAAQINAIPLELDPEITHRANGPQTNPKKTKSQRTNIRIIMPDGDNIVNRKAWESYVEFVQRVGPERVRTLGLVWDKGPLVTNRVDKHYESDFKPLGNGLYLNTHFGNTDKKRYIERIAQALGIKVSVEIFKCGNGEDSNILPDDEQESGSTDKPAKRRSLFSLNGSAPMAKNRSVWATVKHYLESEAPYFNEIQAAFPASLQGSYGVVRTLEDINERCARNKTESERWFLDDDEILISVDGVSFAVCKEWGDNFDAFRKHVNNVLKLPLIEV